jgi:hypothetical protein
MAPDMLSLRAMNRALLACQLLLERDHRSAAGAVDLPEFDNVALAHADRAHAIDGNGTGYTPVAGRGGPRER